MHPANYYIGLDNSITCTGMTVLDSNGDTVKSYAFVGEKVAKKWGFLIEKVFNNSLRKQQFSKMVGIREEVLRVIDDLPIKNSGKDNVICIGIENYSYASKGKQTLLGEFGGIMREAVAEHCEQIFEFAPQAVKKFITGNGNSPKDVVLLNVYKKYKEEFEDIKGRYKLDAADSYVVAKICYHYASGDLDNLTKNQLDVLAKIRETESK